MATERRAGQPITPLRLFASRQRSGAYVARVLLVGGMFGMFFFVTQYLQGVLGFSALQAGMAFLPMSVAMFAVARSVPRYAERVGDGVLLTGGVSLALAGMVVDEPAVGRHRLLPRPGDPDAAARHRHGRRLHAAHGSRA